MTATPALCTCGQPAMMTAITASAETHLCADCFAKLRATGQDITYTVIPTPPPVTRVAGEVGT